MVHLPGNLVVLIETLVDADDLKIAVLRDCDGIVPAVTEQFRDELDRLGNPPDVFAMADCDLVSAWIHPYHH